MKINRRTVLFLMSIGMMQPASAVLIAVNGSFDESSLAHSHFIFDRFYNQDGISPAPVSLPGNLITSTDSVAYFGWGIDVTDSIIQQEIIQSHFWFNGTGSAGGGSAIDVLSGDTFSLGMFTYTNEETIFSGGLVQIDFRMDINFGGQLLDTGYRIEIDNTVNGSATPEDTARLISPLPGPQTIAFSGVQYQLTYNGFSRDGGLTFETEATLAEGAQTRAEIFATLTEISAVPVPAAVWLFASGFLALIGIARRKN